MLACEENVAMAIELIMSGETAGGSEAAGVVER